MQSGDPSKQRALVDRLFARFAAMYGAQKLASMWAGADLESVKETWGAALSRYSTHSIGQAVADLLASGEDWPPTLPRFAEMCRQAGIARHQAQDAAQALPAPGRSFTDRQSADRMLSAIDVRGNRGDPKAWARRIMDAVSAGEDVSACRRSMAMRALNLKEAA